MLNLTRLRMLREVAYRGTIAAAAEALYMSASAVSQQMSVLEREAGIPLLERVGRGVQPTEAGRRLVANTERILAEMERAEADLAAASQGIVGRVRVSAFPSAARAVLVPALVRVRAKHPNLHVSMIELEPEESLPSLKARELDLVLDYEWDLLPSIEDPGLVREELLSEPVYLTLPADHPLSRRGGAVAIAELSGEQWIVGRDSTSMLDLVTAAARKAGFEPRTDFHSMDFEVILAGVAAGLGVALVPQLAMSSDLPGIAVRETADMSLNRSIWASIRRGSGLAPGISAVLEALREVSSTVSTRIPDRQDER